MFPNMKAIRRRGGQPRPPPMQGWPPTARPPARGRLAAAKASSKGRPAGIAACSVTSAKGSTTGCLQGVAARGQPCRQ
ncbi:hypothetical protein B296_00051349 [Ensete ventricosum]|uniref:Uncharacterized protein n=1 Tax=Ensete ventricosum TaxID=4639 RepID=A0A426X2I1_ENSVE|nr:hypothetical protein B296_00051349 [Ensete ventricosum]